MPKKFSKKRRTRGKKIHKKTRRNRKGGLLFNQEVGIAGINMSKSTGQKQYNWQTGKWDDYVCYGIGPLKGCKVVPAK
jgi:hypothetical protein